MSVSIDLRAELLQGLGAEFAGAGKVAQSAIPVGTPFPYVWFQRSGDITNRTLDGTPYERLVDYDLECVSDSIDEAQALAAEVKGVLDGYQGYLGSGSGATWVMELFVNDHTDDYVPRNVDENLHVAALRINLLTPQ